MCDIVPRYDMATTNRHGTVRTYAIAEPLDDDGGCTVLDPVSDTSYHVVDCADSILEEKLARRTVGEAVRMSLSPADPDGLDWVVTRIAPGSPVTPGVGR